MVFFIYSPFNIFFGGFNKICVYFFSEQKYKCLLAWCFLGRWEECAPWKAEEILANLTLWRNYCGTETHFLQLKHTHTLGESHFQTWRCGHQCHPKWDSNCEYLQAPSTPNCLPFHSRTSESYLFMTQKTTTALF